MILKKTKDRHLDDYVKYILFLYKRILPETILYLNKQLCDFVKREGKYLWKLYTTQITLAYVVKDLFVGSMRLKSDDTFSLIVSKMYTFPI